MSCGTRVPATLVVTPRKGLSPSMADRSKSVSLATSNAISQALQPREYHYFRFGLVPVRSPLLGESLSCLLFLRVLRCFTSPGSLPDTYEFSIRIPAIAGWWVAPFGDLRIIACERLPSAYRSRPRPSSRSIVTGKPDGANLHHPPLNT